MSRGRSSYRARSSSPRTTMKSEDPLRCGENVLDSMWIPQIATLGRVRWPLRGTYLFTLSRDDHEAAQAYVDRLAGSDTPRRRELRPVDPRATHASEIAQPIGALLVGDPSVFARHRKVGELDRALRPATDGGAGLRHVECRSRAALGLESEGDPIRGWRLELARGFVEEDRSLHGDRLRHLGLCRRLFRERALDNGDGLGFARFDDFRSGGGPRSRYLHLLSGRCRRT